MTVTTMADVLANVRKRGVAKKPVSAKRAEVLKKWGEQSFKVAQENLKVKELKKAKQSGKKNISYFPKEHCKRMVLAVEHETAREAQDRRNRGEYTEQELGCLKVLKPQHSFLATPLVIYSGIDADQ